MSILLAAAAWIAIATSESTNSRLVVMPSSVQASVVSGRSVIMGRFGIVKIKESEVEDRTIWLVERSTCQVGGRIYASGSSNEPVERSWKPNGNSFVDLIGVYLCSAKVSKNQDLDVAPKPQKPQNPLKLESSPGLTEV